MNIFLDTVARKLKENDNYKLARVRNITRLPPTTPTTDHNQKPPYYNIRLPKNIVPMHYDIFLDVNMESLEVNGTATISVQITNRTRYVIIHAASDLVITGLVTNRMTGRIAPVSRQVNHWKNEYHVIELKEELEPGFYALQYWFSYKLKKNLRGFYVSMLKGKNGVKE